MAGAAGVTVVLVLGAGVGLDVVIVVLPAVARAVLAFPAGLAGFGLGEVLPLVFGCDYHCLAEVFRYGVVLAAAARAMFAVAAGCADLGLAAVVGVAAAGSGALGRAGEPALARHEAAVMGARVDFPGFRICDELAGDGCVVTVAGHGASAVFAMWHSCPFGVVVGMVLCNAHRTNKQRESPLPREAGGGTRDRETTHQPISSVTSAFAAGLRFAAGLAAGFAAGFATRSFGKEA